MPYIVAVIALVVASIGFTLFQSSNTTSPVATTEPVALEVASTSPEAPLDTAPVPTDTPTEAPVDTTTSETPATTPDKVPSPTPAPATKPEPSPAPTPTPAPSSKYTYKNGTYRTQSSYRTPRGQYQLDVTVTVSNDKITAANVLFDSKGASDGYSRSFSEAYKSAVVGQSLGSVQPSRIGGASLTTRAFNSALANIRTQAS